MDAALSSLIAVLGFVVNLFASGHAVLWKRDSRAAIGWVGLIWLVPFVGSLLYFFLGVNRIRRKASALGWVHEEPQHVDLEPGGIASPWSTGERAEFAQLSHLAETISRRPRCGGNRVTLLENGDEAFPAMLEAIAEARNSIGLCSYIFDADEVGTRFVEALAEAVKRGVQVRVLVDAVGARYSFPPITRSLQRRGVPFSRFLPPLRASTLAFFNLRNHRKLMLVDGAVAFTGGMNIRAGHVLSGSPRHPVRDVHFRVEGPVVAQLRRAFADDWAFTTREALEGAAWFPRLEARGSTVARVITDGPDDDLEVLRTLMLGALSSARESVRIVTPYFLPDAGMLSALAVTALRGVRVDIVLPKASNLPLVQWATMAILWQVVAPGCNIYLSEGAFDHTKLMIVDRTWLLLGSTNWDSRSLRLNFELNMECYDPALAGQADELAQKRIGSARRLTLGELDGRSLPVRLRDGVARLLSPYL